MADRAHIERFDPLEGALGFSFATRVGNTIYTAGCIGFDSATMEVPADLEAEARMAFDMASLCLGGFGATLADVVDMTTFIAGDLAVVYPPFQQVRTELMAGNLPSSASVGVSALLIPQLHYEIKMIAALAEPRDA